MAEAAEATKAWHQRLQGQRFEDSAELRLSARDRERVADPLAHPPEPSARLIKAARDLPESPPACEWSSGNIFADLGFEHPEEELAKANLTVQRHRACADQTAAPARGITVAPEE